MYYCKPTEYTVINQVSFILLDSMDSYGIPVRYLDQVLLKRCALSGEYLQLSRVLRYVNT